MNTARALIVAAFPTEGVNSRACEDKMPGLLHALATIVDNNPKPFLQMLRLIQTELCDDACREECDFLMHILFQMSKNRAPKETVKFVIDLLSKGHRKRAIELLDELQNDRIQRKKNWWETNKETIERARQRANAELRRLRQG